MKKTQQLYLHEHFHQLPLREREIFPVPVIDMYCTHRTANYSTPWDEY